MWSRRGSSANLDVGDGLAIEGFLNWCRAERGLSENTLDGYARDLARLREYLKHRGLTDPGDVTQQLLSDWLVDMHDDGLAASSIARHRVAMRQLFKFLVDEALIPDNPSLLISAPRIPRKLPSTLTEAQVGAILKELPTEVGP